MTPIDFFNMFDLALFGACFVYFHPVSGMVDGLID
jgi:hypothetical protein